MSNTNELPTITENDPSSCSTGCCKLCPGVWRAALWVPAIVVLSGLAAVAMFPDLADYGYPLIGKPSHIGFTGERPCPGGLCPVSIATSRSADAKQPVRSSESAVPPCCATPTSRAQSFCCPVTAGASSSESATEAVSGEPLTEAMPQDESPADAITVLSSVDAETPSN